jgi:hypothetical protein
MGPALQFALHSLRTSVAAILGGVGSVIISPVVIVPGPA